MSDEAKVADRMVSDEWTWLQDYVYAWADWTINCPEDRTCQVGMGIKAFGGPMGEKIRFSGYREFKTIGAGAVHVRVVDGKGECRVRLDQGKVGLVRIIDGTFP
jgi:hypothetical protein